jgi:cob(I)alamin adenosyltransferase
MTIRSRKGDEGFTDLLMQRRVSKDSSYTRAIGDLDEFNSYLGLVMAKLRSRKEKEMMGRIQTSISVIASELAVGKEKRKKLGILLKKEEVNWIESMLYELEQKVEIEKCFYVTGETEIAALINIARAVARRAERSVVALLREEKEKSRDIMSYMNCLSDLLFVMSRAKAKKKKSKRKKKR